MARKKEKARSVGKRQRNPVVYIICEGKETEITYFKTFRSRNSLISIEPLPSKYQAAKELVEHAYSKVKQLNYSPEDNDELWCVFDRDDNTDSALQQAERLADECGYHIAYSNPSFELWYLLHFIDQQGELMDGAAAEAALSRQGRLPGYDKSQDYAAILKPHQANALLHANRRIEKLRQDGTPLHRRVGNPYTTVGKLVEHLLTRSFTSNG